MIEVSSSPKNAATFEGHFGFRETPFGVTPDPRFFYGNALYLEALAGLVYGIKAKKGVMLLTGEVGTGKTILVRKLIRHLEATVGFVFISASRFTSYGLVEIMLQELGLPNKEKSRLEMIHELKEYLLQQLRSGDTVTLLIDEAQNLSDGAFEGLCDLSNLETDNEKLLQIVLVGQPELMTKLSKPALRRIQQRIAIQHRLSALPTMDEVEHYIRYRLEVAGYQGPGIFTKEAVEAIWHYSAGTPRIINMICDNSLVLAYEAADKQVSADRVIKAASGFQSARGIEVPKIEPLELAVAPTGRINAKTKTNGTVVKLGDRIAAPAEPVALSPAEGRLPSVSSESFDHPGRAAAEPPVSTDHLVFDDQIAAFGESSDTLPQQKPGEIEFLKPVNKAMRASFQKRIGVRWKIGGTFTGVILILCIFGLAAIYQVTQRTLRDQLDKRMLAIATNLSDAAAGHLVSKNLLALHALIRKYTLLDGLAYAFIIDGEREIVAHSLGNIPTELRQGLPVGGQRSASRRELSLHDKNVYETSVPVLEGQMGSVHVGFWADAIEKEIQSALLPLVAIMAILPVVGALLSFLLAHWIARPIVRLREVAEKITTGDLDASGDCVKSRDEIGDLAVSLERMRASLKAAIFRLSRASM